MKMNLIKFILTTLLFFGGNLSFASSLNAIEIKTAPSDTKIFLETDYNSFVKKTNISPNQIQLVLKNTSIAENIQTKVDSNNSLNGISLVQDGKDAYICISGLNTSDISVINSSTNNNLPLNTHSKDLSAGLYILLFLAGTSLLSFLVNKKVSSKSATKPFVEYSFHKNEIKNNINIKEYTIRNTVSNASCVSIHGNPTLKFSQNGKTSVVSIPETLSQRHSNYINSTVLKKAVNT